MPLHATRPQVDQRTGGWQRMVAIYDRAVAIPATPGAVLIDEEVNVGPWGLLATTYRHFNLCWVIEKWDATLNGGAGDWRATYQTAAATPPSGANAPANEVLGYGTKVRFWGSPMARPHLPGGDPFVEDYDGYPGPYGRSGQDCGRDMEVGPDSVAWLNGRWPEPEDRLSRFRIIATRDTHVYTVEEQAIIDPLAYRLRVVVYAINLVLWEKEVPITAGNGDVLINETIDLMEYGLASDHDRFAFVADLRRNGKTIRTQLSREYQVGEALDPPTAPIHFNAYGILPGTPVWNEQNGNNWGVLELYGSNGGGGFLAYPDESHFAGTWLGTETNNCSQSCQQYIQVQAYRKGVTPSAYATGAPGTLAVAVWPTIATFQATVAGAAITGNIVVGTTNVAPASLVSGWQVIEHAAQGAKCVIERL